MRRFSLVAILASALLVGAVGCGGGNSGYKTADDIKKAPAAHDDHDHDHNAKGPHGGSLVELGDEEFHAEVVLDHDQHALRVFVLGKDAKTAQATAAKEITVASEGKDAWTLKAAPQEGDGEGKASRFELIDDSIVHNILDAKFMHGDLRISIDGKPFSGHIDMHLDDVHHEHKDDAKPAEEKKEADAPKADGDTK